MTASRSFGPAARASGPARSDALLGACVLVVLVATVAAALSLRPPTLDERARGLEAQLRCPSCQGTSIADSPAGSAEQMRDVIREQVTAGARDEEVLAWFVERYGPWVLLAPEPKGPALLLWLAPGIGLVLGAGILVALRRRRSGDPVAEPVHGSGASQAAPVQPSGAPSPGAAPVSRAPQPAAGPGSGPSPSAPASAAAPSRLAAVIGVGVVVLAVAVPLAATVVPRASGGEMTGRQPEAGAGPPLEVLEAAAAAEPDDAEALGALGDAYLSLGRAGDAAEAYVAALEVEPDDPSALLGLSLVLIGSGESREAIPLLDRVIERDGLAEAHLYRGLARYQLSGVLTNPAETDILRFLEAAPGDPRARLAREILEADAPPGSAP